MVFIQQAPHRIIHIFNKSTSLEGEIVRAFRHYLLWLMVGIILAGPTYGIAIWALNAPNDYPNAWWIMMTIGVVGAVSALWPEIVGPRQAPRHGGLPVRMNPPPAQAGGGPQPNGNGGNNAAQAVAVPVQQAQQGAFMRALTWVGNALAAHWAVTLGAVSAIIALILGYNAWTTEEDVGLWVFTIVFTLASFIFFLLATNQLGNAGNLLLTRSGAGIAWGLWCLAVAILAGKHAYLEGYNVWTYPGVWIAVFLSYMGFRIAWSNPSGREWLVYGTAISGIVLYVAVTFETTIEGMERLLASAGMIPDWGVAVLYTMAVAIPSAVAYGVYRRFTR